MRDGRGAPARGRARVPGGTWRRARADLRPVSGCDSCVKCCGPENVPNSAAAARNGQSGICRHRDVDASIKIVFRGTEVHQVCAFGFVYRYRSRGDISA